jgi:pimeloyl-ACP methyl ester carboxylesterase
VKSSPPPPTGLATTLVLLPGLDGTEIFFGPLLRHLPPWVQPKVIEYPATGGNDYDRLLAIVQEQVAPLGRFALLGWSFGGPLALMIASQRAAQVSAIVLCGTFVTPPRPGLVPFRFALTGPVIATVRALRRTRLLLPGYATSELRRAKARTWQRVSARVLAARARAALAVDARAHLRECRARLMYLASTRDEVVGRRSRDEVLALAPQTRLAEVEGPHLALFTNPAASAAHIAGFLREA